MGLCGNTPGFTMLLSKSRGSFSLFGAKVLLLIGFFAGQTSPQVVSEGIVLYFV